MLSYVQYTFLRSSHILVVLHVVLLITLSAILAAALAAVVTAMSNILQPDSI